MRVVVLIVAAFALVRELLLAAERAQLSREAARERAELLNRLLHDEKPYVEPIVKPVPPPPFPPTPPAPDEPDPWAMVGVEVRGDDA